MAIKLPHDLTPAEIRILQEYRRLNAETLPLATLTAIKHPAGGGERSVAGLVQKGFLAADAGSESYSLTGTARDFLAIEAKPEVAETSDAAVSAAKNPGADGV
jgi:hypothetical protein